jgi:bifunctional DNA-binding transcriptional regulator/antitoxin component of YhaV-PrlF toxin-antitoxin module
MKENLVVSDRGQVTLPAGMRKSLGLGRNAVLTAESVGGKIVLTPAVVIETEMYSESEIAEFDRADVLDKKDRGRLSSRLKKPRG